MNKLVKKINNRRRFATSYFMAAIARMTYIPRGFNRGFTVWECFFFGF